MGIKSKKPSKGKTVKNAGTDVATTSTSTSKAATSSTTTSTSTTSRESHHIQSSSSPSIKNKNSKIIDGVTITEVSADTGGLGHAESSSTKCVVVQPDIVDNLLGENRIGSATQVVHYETKSSGSATSEFIAQEKSSSYYEKRGERIYTVGDRIVHEVSNPITEIIESEYSSKASNFAKFSDAGGNNIGAVTGHLSTSSTYDNLYDSKQIHGIETTTNVINAKQSDHEIGKSATSYASTDYKLNTMHPVDDKFGVNTDKSKILTGDTYNVQTTTSTAAASSTIESGSKQTKANFGRNKGHWDGTFTYEKKVDVGGHSSSLLSSNLLSDNKLSSNSTSNVQKTNVFESDSISTYDNLSTGDRTDGNLFSATSKSHEIYEKSGIIGDHEFDVKYSIAKSHSNKNIGSNITEQQFTENVVITKDVKTVESSSLASDFKQISNYDYTSAINNTNLDATHKNTDYSTTIIDSNNLRSDSYTTAIVGGPIDAPTTNYKLNDSVTTYTSKAWDDKSKKWYVVDESTVNEGNIVSSDNRSNAASTSKTTTSTTANNNIGKKLITTKTNNEATDKTKITNKKSTTSSAKDIASNQTTISQQLYDEKSKKWVDVDEKTYTSKRPSLMRYVSQDNDGKYTTIYKKKVFDKRSGTWKVVEEKSYRNNYFNQHIPEVIDDVANTTTTTYVTKVFDTKTNTWKIVDEQSFTDTKTIVPADIAEEIARDQADVANIITTTEITKVKSFNIFFHSAQKYTYLLYL